MHKQIILVGYFSEMAELCQRCGYIISGYIDNQIIPDIPYAYLGSDNDIITLYEKYHDTPIVITPDAPKIRERLFYLYKNVGFKFQNIISPTSYVSPSAQLGIGIVIQHGVNISSNTIIGNFVKLNTNANVMHDCTIKDYVTVAPNAVILGDVLVENNSYIGANSTILPHCKISSNVTVGAGAVVTKNITKDKVVKGIPAQ